MKGSKRMDFLGMLMRSKTTKRRKLLAQWADKNDLMAISEFIRKILRGDVKLTPAQLKKIKQHKKSLRILAKKTGPLSEKRKAITQHGGFFFPFLSRRSLVKAAHKTGRVLTSSPVLKTATTAARLIRSAWKVAKRWIERTFWSCWHGVRIRNVASC